MHLYDDADFTGCLETSRSTSGVYLCIHGPGAAFPIAGSSKRQTNVSHSTPEAEIAAADFAIRTIGIPALTLWSTLLRKDVCLQFHEDSQAVIAVMRAGRPDKLRHLNRTRRVSIDWLHERSQDPAYDLIWEKSAKQAADIFTTAFPDIHKMAKHMCSN